MRTMLVLIVLTILNWKEPAGVGDRLCDTQMLGLFRLFIPLGVVMILFDILGFTIRILARRHQQEKSDYEWMLSWVDQQMKIR